MHNLIALKVGNPHNLLHSLKLVFLHEIKRALPIIILAADHFPGVLLLAQFQIRWLIKKSFVLYDAHRISLILRQDFLAEIKCKGLIFRLKVLALRAVFVIIGQLFLWNFLKNCWIFQTIWWGVSLNIRLTRCRSLLVQYNRVIYKLEMWMLRLLILILHVIR